MSQTFEKKTCTRYNIADRQIVQKIQKTVKNTKLKTQKGN